MFIWTFFKDVNNLIFDIFMENIININNILEILPIFTFQSTFWSFMWMSWERGSISIACENKREAFEVITFIFLFKNFFKI